MKDIYKAISEAGGKPYAVGGSVRDEIMGFEPKDIDVEVYGLPLSKLKEVLEKFGPVDEIGQAFGILELHNFDIDFSIPRKDNCIGKGHKDFEVSCDPNMSIKEAAGRRDLTMNSIAKDLITGELCDPYCGVEDIKEKILRATNPDTFLEDPLRALRVAQFISRFSFKPDSELINLCSKADLSKLSSERILEEFRKLLQGCNPFAGLMFLKIANMLRFFPELKAMQNCEQNPDWHPEGNVFNHTMVTVHNLRSMTGDFTLLMAALLHDIGKPEVTELEDGVLKSKKHESKGVSVAQSFLERLKAPNRMIISVCTLIKYHMAPLRLIKDKAGLSSFKRLARKLGDAHTTMTALELLARADKLGSPNNSDRELFEFYKIVKENKLDEKPEPDIVMGRHLIERDMVPGKEFGIILKKCREIQEETGLKDVEEILKRAK